MVLFTILEAIVGLFIILGLFTRLTSIGIFSLAMGILLGSGWIGTTCLDEWQIGVLGIASGFTLFLTGSGYFSLDHYLLKKYPSLHISKAFQWLGSGILPEVISKKVILVGSLMIFGLILFTNQYFHGGVFGELHNKSVKPKLELSNVVKKRYVSFSRSLSCGRCRCLRLVFDRNSIIISKQSSLKRMERR